MPSFMGTRNLTSSTWGRNSAVGLRTPRPRESEGNVVVHRAAAGGPAAAAAGIALEVLRERLGRLGVSPPATAGRPTLARLARALDAGARSFAARTSAAAGE